MEPLMVLEPHGVRDVVWAGGVFLFAGKRIKDAVSVWVECKWCDHDDDGAGANRWLTLSSVDAGDGLLDLVSTTSWEIAVKVAPDMELDEGAWEPDTIQYRFPEPAELAARGLGISGISSHMVAIGVAESEILTAATIGALLAKKQEVAGLWKKGAT